jgi:hypothetical protein
MCNVTGLRTEHGPQLGIMLIRAALKQNCMKIRNLIYSEKCVMPVTWDIHYGQFVKWQAELSTLLNLF